MEFKTGSLKVYDRCEDGWLSVGTQNTSEPLVCDMIGWKDGDRSIEEARAYAALFAAAPDLLTACQAALRQLQFAHENVVNVGGNDSAEAKAIEPTIKAVAAAIRKAFGGQ